MMRSTLDIVIAAKDGEPATEQELRLALCAMSAMLHFAEKNGSELADGVIEGKPSAKMRAGFLKHEHEIRWKARKMPVDEYLGDENIPGTPENLQFRQIAERIFEKATGEKL